MIRELPKVDPDNERFEAKMTVLDELIEHRSTSPARLRRRESPRVVDFLPRQTMQKTMSLGRFHSKYWNMTPRLIV